jgi:xanthine dehydrogenase YagR molybdenum-binding subunit
MPYAFALETALDELSGKLGMDPIELRRVNDTWVEPVRGLPYTSRSLMRCFDEAAAAFGWKDRTSEPGSVRDGDWLVGWGCAGAFYPTQAGNSAARVRLTVALGDSDLPPAVVTGGSSSTASVAPTIMAACDAIRRRLGVATASPADVMPAMMASGMGVVEEFAEARAHGLPPESVRTCIAARPCLPAA